MASRIDKPADHHPQVDEQSAGDVKSPADQGDMLTQAVNALAEASDEFANGPQADDDKENEAANQDESGSASFPDKDWKFKLKLAKNGSISPDLRNVRVAFDGTGTTSALRYNAMTHSIEWDTDRARSSEVRDLPAGPIHAEHLGSLKVLVHVHGVNASSATLREAVYNKALQNKYHPVQEYLRHLLRERDGQVLSVDQAVSKILKYLDMEDTGHNGAIVKKWLIWIVARPHTNNVNTDPTAHPFHIARGGLKIDNLLILEGPEASNVLKIIAGEWYSNLANVRDRNVQQIINRSWIIEVPADVALKDNTFLTEITDNQKRPHDSEARAYPRGCVFVGTSRKRVYIDHHEDCTALVATLGDAVNLLALQKDMPQILATFYHAYRYDADLHTIGKFDPLTDAHLIKQFATTRHLRSFAHSCADQVDEYLKKISKPGDDYREYLLSSNIRPLINTYFKDYSNSKLDIEVRKVMTELGWEHTTKSVMRNNKGEKGLQTGWFQKKHTRTDDFD